MDYELCKKLKDAGLIWKNRDNFEVYKEDELPLAYYPTLSELIEACGDEFDKLDSPIWELPKTHPERVWTAAGGEAYTPFCDGKTPEEAVAKLWLAIHSQELKDSTDMID
jgi:hypothetical protein